MRGRRITAGLLIISGLLSIATGEGCAREDHQKCITYADPLLKDPHLIFPDNVQDIDLVCRTWSGFVDCIKRYIDRCFSKLRRDQFNAAVEAPIASVHQMCSVSTYQAEYLQYASCLKATVTETQHCGSEYLALVAEVSKGEMARASLCCAHHQFRTCVISETRKRCDRGQPDGAASRFSRQILDRALSFLQNQCQNYSPHHTDCDNPVTDNSIALSVSSLDVDSGARVSNRRPYHRTLSTDSYAGQASSFHGASTSAANQASSFRSTGRSLNVLPKNEDLNSRGSSTAESADLEAQTTAKSSTVDAVAAATSKIEETSSVKTPEEPQASSTASHSIEEPAIVVTQRSNYGRGISWTSPAPKATTEIPAWATSTWQNSNQDPVTESWFPAAGSFGGNNIDEPNQQGLRNGQLSLKSSLAFMVVLTVIMIFV